MVNNIVDKKELAENISEGDKAIDEKKQDTGTMAQYILKRILCAQPKTAPLKSLDLTQSQEVLLKKLFSARESGVELKMSDFSAMMGSTKSAISQAVAKLERMGLVKRKWSKQDRRRVLVGLTPKGTEVAETFNRDFLEFIQSKLDKMDEEELCVFMKIFEKFMD